MQPLSLVPAPKRVIRKSGFFYVSAETAIIIQDTIIKTFPVVSALELASFLDLDALDHSKENDSGSSNNATVIASADQLSGVRQFAELLDSWLLLLRARTGFGLPLAEHYASTKQSSTSENHDTIPTKQNIVLAIDDTDTKSSGLEEYTLEVTKTHITLSATTAVGFYFGLQSLLQIIEPSAEPSQVAKTTQVAVVPCCVITDAPRFAWRGLHLDSGRHFQPLDGVKRCIDTMALNKLNVFHWHLTEDQGWRIEIRKYPKLTQIGSKRKATCWGHLEGAGKHLDDGVPHQGFYTQDEIREIVQYARDRCIMVVPEIDLPGHSRAAIAAYPELGIWGDQLEVCTCWGVSSDIYNPEEKTIAFLQDVLREVLQLFPSPWIHIGGDEAIKDQWQANDRVQELIEERGLANEHELQSWFLHRIAIYLQGLGRQVIGWDEIMDGGTPDHAIVMAWRNEAMGVRAAQEGHKVLMAPCQRTYLDRRPEHNNFEMLDICHDADWNGNKDLFFPLEWYYQWNPIPEALSQKEQKLVMGGQGQLWTEYMPNPKVVEYMAWPRASALAERLWSPADYQDFAEFSQRLESLLDLLDYRGIAYCMQDLLVAGPAVEVKEVSNEYKVLLSELDNFPATFRRIQIHFGRSSTEGYALIHKVQLKAADGRTWIDNTQGYVGDFNRLNMYIFGNGTPIQSQGATLFFTLASCSQVPTKNEYPIADCSVAFAWRTR